MGQAFVQQLWMVEYLICSVLFIFLYPLNIGKHVHHTSGGHPLGAGVVRWPCEQMGQVFGLGEL